MTELMTVFLPDALRFVWRAHVDAPAAMHEITVFVQAGDRASAHARICSVLAAIYPNITPAEIGEAVYNLIDARELLEQGSSAVPAHRLFETSWTGDRVASWVEQPIFALSEPALAIRHWIEARAATLSQMPGANANGR